MKSNKQIQNLRNLIKENLNTSKVEIKNRFGNPSGKSDNGVWFYRTFKFSPINYKTIFIFDEDIVVDIFIYEYFFWIEVKNFYYFEGKDPEFKEVSFL